MGETPLNRLIKVAWRFGRRQPKLLTRVLVIGGVACWLAGFGLIASAGVSVALGDSNSGDVWVDNVSQPSGPGHEMDPHLACQDINLWGAGLADGSGVYTIDGWPDTKAGPGRTAPWSYDSSTGASQVISVIDVTTLISDAIANGDAPVNSQGYHFKLEFSQDPLKHKTFWVSCQAPTPTPTPTSTPTPSTPTPTPSTSTPTPTPRHTPKPTPTLTPASTTTPTPTPTGSSLGASTSSPSPSPSSSGTGAALGAGTSTPTTGAGSGVFWGGWALVLLGVLLMGAAATVRRSGFPTPG